MKRQINTLTSTTKKIWHDFKRAVHNRCPKNTEKLCTEEWYKIPPEHCAAIICNYRICLLEVIASSHVHLPCTLILQHFPFIPTGLSLFWTSASKKGFSLFDTVRLLCKEPAKLCRLDNQKGNLIPGHDADLVIWDPEKQFTVRMRWIKEIIRYIIRTCLFKLHLQQYWFHLFFQVKEEHIHHKNKVSKTKDV